MKQIIFKVTENTQLTETVYKMSMTGDVSGITCGQFVNILLKGKYLRRPISVCDVTPNTLTIIYKVVGEGTAVMSKMKPGDTLDVLCGLGNGFDVSKSSEKPVLFIK